MSAAMPSSAAVRAVAMGVHQKAGSRHHSSDAPPQLGASYANHSGALSYEMPPEYGILVYPATMRLDRIDYQILHYVQNDGRISNVELAEKVGLSPSPCLRRVKALEQAGVLKRYVGIVDANAVGLGISAF